MVTFNKANFKQTWVNQDEMYMVGFDKRTKEKVIVVTISWIAWYDIYFRITEQEYGWHTTNLEDLNDLASRMAVDKGNNFYKDRLLLSEGPTR